MLRFTDELIAAMARTSAVFVSLTLILSALAGIGSSSAGAQSAPAAAVAPDQIVIEGKGFGHGRGLGQYGALGYAVDDGWTYEQILDQYYGNTTFGEIVADEDIKVHLTALNRTPLRITANTPFSVAGVEFAAGEAARIRLEESIGLLWTAGPIAPVPTGRPLPPASMAPRAKTAIRSSKRSSGWPSKATT